MAASNATNASTIFFEEDAKANATSAATDADANAADAEKRRLGGGAVSAAPSRRCAVPGSPGTVSAQSWDARLASFVGSGCGSGGLLCVCRRAWSKPTYFADVPESVRGLQYTKHSRPPGDAGNGGWGLAISYVPPLTLYLLVAEQWVDKFEAVVKPLGWLEDSKWFDQVFLSTRDANGSSTNARVYYQWMDSGSATQIPGLAVV